LRAKVPAPALAAAPLVRASGAARTLLIGGVAIAIVAIFVAPVQDPDFWWHLKIGQWMLANAQLPSHDIFTFTARDHTWTDHEYATEVLMALAYGAGGALLISLAFGAITWLGFWLIHQAARGRHQPYVVVGLALALAAVAGGPIWGPRAQMITFFLSCLEMYWLRRYLEGRSRAIQWFPLVMVGWANLHGGWVIGFVFLGIALGTEALQWAFDRSSHLHRARVRTLSLVLGASALAVLATPHGPGLYLYPFQTHGSEAQQRLIVEWFSPDFHQNFLRPFEAMVFVLFAGFALRRPSLYDFVLSLAALALALQSVRHIALFIAAATPILITTWSEIWRDLARRRSFRLGQAAVSPLLPAVTALALIVITAATGARTAAQLTRQATLTRQDYPVQAADWLGTHPEVGHRMYNQYGWGGYLAYRFYPDTDRRVFIFGEAALMGDRLLQQYQDVQTLRPDWRQVLDQHGIDYVVYNRGEALANVLDGDARWERVYQDETAVIFVRKS
jgi:hypothetical protein